MTAQMARAVTTYKAAPPNTNKIDLRLMNFRILSCLSNIQKIFTDQVAVKYKGPERFITYIYLFSIG